MRWYWRALELTEHSPYPVPNKRMAAVVVRSGSVLSQATNISRHFGLPFTRGKHAETRALRPHQCYQGAVLYVARRNGLTSRPCPECLTAARDAGIEKIVYAGVSGELITERLR